VAAKAGVTNDRWGFGVRWATLTTTAGPTLRGQLRQEPPLPQQPRRHLYRHCESAGVTLGNWSTGPSFGDYDGDGRLDLFVPGYIHWDMNNLPHGRIEGRRFCELLSSAARKPCAARAGCRASRTTLPQQRRRHLYRCQRQRPAWSDKRRYYGFSSTFVDIDNDGKVDL
jgi:enediyne biosynthesis protein E4